MHRMSFGFALLLSMLVLCGFFTVTTYAKNSENGWKTIDGETYYYEDGEAQTGRQKIDGNYYYFDSEGVMQTGWQEIKNKTYYFYKKGDNKGQAMTGLHKIKGYYYYFNKKGVMQTGWQEIDGDKYFFYKKGDHKGQAATGIVEIGDKVYSFTDKGVKVTGLKAQMDKKAYNKSSDTKYLILVDKSNYQVAIYKGSKKNWKRIKFFKCAIGASDTETIEGTFSMGPSGGRAFKLKYFDAEGGVRCWYASRIKGGYMFHSILYWPTSSPTDSAIANARLGAKISHGCIRLALKNAKWIYDKIPEGTKVIIYSS